MVLSKGISMLRNGRETWAVPYRQAPIKYTAKPHCYTCTVICSTLGE